MRFRPFKVPRDVGFAPSGCWVPNRKYGLLALDRRHRGVYDVNFQHGRRKTWEEREREESGLEDFPIQWSRTLSWDCCGTEAQIKASNKQHLSPKSCDITTKASSWAFCKCAHARKSWVFFQTHNVTNTYKVVARLFQVIPRVFPQKIKQPYVSGLPPTPTTVYCTAKIRFFSQPDFSHCCCDHCMECG